MTCNQLICFILKTLFNILEAWFKKIVELWCLCCIMMFRWIKKQPGSFEIDAVTTKIYVTHSLTEYHHLINRPADGLFHHSSLWGEMSMVMQSLPYFHFFEALTDAFEVQFFSGLHSYTISKKLIACGAMHLRFLKWKHCQTMPLNSTIYKLKINMESRWPVHVTIDFYIFHLIHKVGVLTDFLDILLISAFNLSSFGLIKALLFLCWRRAISHSANSLISCA